MRIPLNYRTAEAPRGGVARTVAFAVTLVGVLICIVAPLAVTIASLYLDDAFVILAGAVVSGLFLALALLLAAAAIEQFCDLRD